MSGSASRPAWTRRPAPPPLTGVQSLANTHAYGDHPDVLASAEAASGWLEEVGLHVVPTESDLRRLRRTRRTLRELIGAPPDDSAAVGQEHVVRFDVRGGDVVATGLGSPVAAWCAELVADAWHAARTDGLRRLKVCANDECQVTYWDHTRNRSARFCSATLCANRARQRRHRAGHARNRRRDATP